MKATCRFADQIPDQPLMLSVVPGVAKTTALEEAYANGFTGCFCWRDSGENEAHYNPMGNAARWYRDEFRSNSTKDKDRFFTDICDSLGEWRILAIGTEQGYVASKDAFETYARDQAADHERWLFECLQNSGICVGSSGVEMLHGLLGTRANDPQFAEVFKLLAAQWAYMFRGSCGQGWYMGAHASVTRKYGYAFATQYDLPQTGQLDYDGENDSERKVTSTWCRRQPDDFISHVRDNGWFFSDGAITEFSGGVDALKRLIQARGQLHHGSNYTSGSSTPDRVRRIGGHAQTMFGGDWSERTLKFFGEQGVSFNENDFPCVNHQTWGGGWSGEVADRYWPEWWGPKPQGAWIVGAKNQLRYFSDGYAYLPMLKGIPGDTPPPPPPTTEHPEISGELIGEYEDGKVVIEGEQELTIDGEPNGQYTYIAKPIGGGKYRLIPKPEF